MFLLLQQESNTLAQEHRRTQFPLKPIAVFALLKSILAGGMPNASGFPVFRYIESPACKHRLAKLAIEETSFLLAALCGAAIEEAG
jgi:hypothetical protein